MRLRTIPFVISLNVAKESSITPDTEPPMSTRRHLLLSAISLALILSCTAYATTNSIHSRYALTKTLHLPGPTHWDFLAFDSKEHRLFIT